MIQSCHLKLQSAFFFRKPDIAMQVGTRLPGVALLMVPKYAFDAHVLCTF